MKGKLKKINVWQKTLNSQIKTAGEKTQSTFREAHTYNRKKNTNWNNLYEEKKLNMPTLYTQIIWLYTFTKHSVAWPTW
jgi:hypothetical protein